MNQEFGNPEEVEAWTKPDSEDEYNSDCEEKGSDDDDDESETATSGKRNAKRNYINGYYHEIYRPGCPAKLEDVPVRDWNEEFQSILSQLSNCNGTEEEKLQRYNQLSNLAHGSSPTLLRNFSFCSSPRNCFLNLSQNTQRFRVCGEDLWQNYNFGAVSAASEENYQAC